MVKLNNRLNTTFAALADMTRRQILVRLRRGEIGVSELARPFDMSLAAVSKHLNVLEDAKLVKRRKSGREVLVSLSMVRLKEAESWLSDYREFWEKSLDRLEEELNSTKGENDD